MGLLSPIRSVTPIAEDGTVLGSAVTDLPSVVAEDGFVWGESDISSKKAGRRENLVMKKARLGMSKTVTLKWVNLMTTEISAVLQAFSAEYVQVEFLDPKEGGWITRNFYVSDREAVCFNSDLGLWKSAGFTIIQQDADKS